MYRQVSRGITIGLAGVCYGLWLAWRGYRYDLWYTRFGESIIPRWMYIGGGLLIALLSAAYVAFLYNVGGE